MSSTSRDEGLFAVPFDESVEQGLPIAAAAEQRISALETQLQARTAELTDIDRRFRLLVRSVSEYAIFMLDVEGRVANWNSGAERIEGYSEAEILGRHFSIFYTDDDRDCGLPARALEAARRQGSFEAEGWRLRKDGSRFWASVVIEPVHDDAGELIGFAKITRDLTEKRSIEDQLRQAQKMESIGQLTGGIAHDFNNLLAVVVGNLETLKRRFEAMFGGRDPSLLRLAEGALQGADRAAALTRQLLAFSRRQSLDPQPFEAGTLIDGVVELLRRSLGERIAVTTLVPAEIWTAFADTHQLEGALLNLAVNARDAMPEGGRLSIAAANVTIGQDSAGGLALAAGDYVMISVSDTGTGMTEPVLARAFEPFFTTKALGRSSGLGLSQVYGFVKQSSGDAAIESTPGAGTIVRLYLPRFPSVPVEEAGAPGTQAAGPGELILLVEDNELVRPCMVEMLEMLGYRVLAAAEGAAALRLLDAHPDIRLVLTDLGLPGALDGEALADRVRQRFPGVKVLLTSGYVQAGSSTLPRGLDLLGKPFTYARLGEALRRLLDKGKT